MSSLLVRLFFQVESHDKGEKIFQYSLHSHKIVFCIYFEILMLRVQRSMTTMKLINKLIKIIK